MAAPSLLRYALYVILASLLAFGLRLVGGGTIDTSATTPSLGYCGANPGPPRDPSNPAIVLSAPQSGADAGSPLTVSGTARVFEAVVSIALLGPNGDLVAGNDVIAQTTTLADAGAPANGNFSVSVPFSVSAPTDGCLLVYEASARDGSPQNVVQVPLRLEPAASDDSSAAGVGIPLHQVDWASALAHDTSGFVTVIPDCPVPPVDNGADQPCISATATLSALTPGLGGAEFGGQFAGYALLDQIIYGDIDGDGLEEAVIPTESYGTGGSFGFLVYHQGQDAPQLVAAVPGYKVVPSIKSGQLVARQPFYFGFEANCCPSGVMTTPYDDLAGKLVPEQSTFAILGKDGAQQPASAAELLVAGYYRAIDDHAYSFAYDMLGPAMRASQSHDDFVAGFATTQSVSATIAPGDSDDTVNVTVTSVDLAADGSTTTRTFAGTWLVGQRPDGDATIYGVTPYDLELDAASITQTS